MELRWLAAAPGGVVLNIKATPRAAANAVAGVEQGWLRVRLQAPPVDGKANAALTRWLAERLGVPRSAVTLVAGAGARVKRVAVRGIDMRQTAERLGVSL